MEKEKKKYTDLDVWKAARILVNEIYLNTKVFPKDEIFGLTSQMRRCAVSIPSNIAEGCGRNHPKESIQFFFISRGSLYELETQLYKLALESILIQLETTRKLLNGFIKYYSNLAK